MPGTQVYFYCEQSGQVPVLDWLRELRREDKKAYAKCVAKIRRLQELGHELRRPEADYLHDGIYELRIRKGTVNYRVLYFFHGQNVALLCHALTKKAEVPENDIARAIRCRENVVRSPEAHIYETED